MAAAIPIRLYLLGQYRIESDTGPIRLPRRKVEALLAYLALYPTAHPREKLAALLWGDFSDAQARASLRNALAVLRKELGNELLLTEHHSIQINPRYPLWVDALQFERAADLSPRSAINLYRGDLLPANYDDWVILERERLLALFEQKMQQFLEQLMQAQRWPEVLEWSERWIALGRTPEPAYCALMIAHANLGDRSKVASIFQRCAEALRHDLGVEPLEQTQTLYEQLAKGEKLSGIYLNLTRRFSPPALAIEEEPPAPGKPPYKGLQRFDEADAELFFGREWLIAKLVGYLRVHRFLAVIVGASGSGKSSLVRAGLVPALRHGEPLIDGSLPPEGSQDWTIHIITPTAHPLEMLNGIWSDDDRHHRLLVIDQFEELFTLCHDEAERKMFVDHLLADIVPIVSLGEQGTRAAQIENDSTVIITLRADFYAHCAQYPNLREAVAKHQEYIGPMNAEELRRAIEEPARRGGWEFEAGLVDLILRDVGDEPGALPLLSHALLETWKRRRGHYLTLKGYAESGGVRGAIARTAENLFQKLPTEQQAIARRVFLRLTELGEGTEDTRRRAALLELIRRPEDTTAVQELLGILADARLIILEEKTVEVAHEALIHEWPRLREWLTQDREGLRLHRHLTQAAQEWDELGHDAGALYRGARLAQTNEWADANPDELNAPEREFLLASQESAAREGAERESQRQRELQAAQVLAETQLQAAVHAEQLSRLAFARELAAAANNNLDVDPERSILLALQAVSVTYSIDKTWLPEAEVALHRAVETSRARLTLHGFHASTGGVTYTPDGTRLAVQSADGMVSVYDAITGKLFFTISSHSTAGVVGVSVAVSPDGTRFASSGTDGRARLWDARTGNQLLDIPAHERQIAAVAFSADGKRLATASEDGTAKMWDISTTVNSGVATGQPLFTLFHKGFVSGVAFRPDGKRLVTGSEDKTARIWDIESGKELWTLSGHTDAVRAVACSADGTRLATGSNDATVKIWDALTGKLVFTLFGHASFVVAVAFDSTGTRLVSAGEDGTAKVWDVTTGQLLLTLAGHSSGVLGAAFGPNGTHVATTSRDQTARVWDVSPNGGREWLTLCHGDLAVDVAFSPDGNRLATASYDKTAKIWDAETGEELFTLSGHSAAIQAVIFSPDGTHLATASSDGTANVWHNATGQRLLTFPIAPDFGGVSTHGIAFNPDGRRLAAIDSGSLAAIWDAATGEKLITLKGHSDHINRLAFSPDGAWLATASADRTAIIWDALTGQRLLTFSGHSGIVSGIAFSPDGTRLATTSNDGTAKVWDAATGREVFTLSGHQGPVFGVAFRPDGARLATSSVDRTVKIWNVSPGQEYSEPITLYGHSAAVFQVAFSPDGTRLATASRDHTARVYLLQIEDLMALARERLTRTWTLEECRKFLHMEQYPP